MRFTLVLLLAMMVGCAQESVTDTVSYQDQGPIPKSELPSIRRPPELPRLWGEVPLVKLVSVLESLTVIKTSLVNSGSVYLTGPRTIDELNSQLASSGYAIVDGHLVQRQAHHPIESPDPLGRPTDGVPYVPRNMYEVVISFFRVGANGELLPVTVGAGHQSIKYTYLTPAGIEFNLASETERSFFQNVNLPDNQAGALQGERGTVEAGLNLVGFLGVESDQVRLTGLLSVSSFIGSGLDRATTDVPINVDTVLGVDEFVSEVDTTNSNVRLSFSSFDWSASGSAERIRVKVRVQRPDKKESSNYRQQN